MDFWVCYVFSVRISDSKCCSLILLPHVIPTHCVILQLFHFLLLFLLFFSTLSLNYKAHPSLPPTKGKREKKKNLSALHCVCTVPIHTFVSTQSVHITSEPTAHMLQKQTRHLLCVLYSTSLVPFLFGSHTYFSFLLFCQTQQTKEALFLAVMRSNTLFSSVHVR